MVVCYFLPRTIIHNSIIQMQVQYAAVYPGPVYVQKQMQYANIYLGPCLSTDVTASALRHGYRMDIGSKVIHSNMSMLT